MNKFHKLVNFNVDDIDYIKNELKGINGLLEALDVTLKNGITQASVA